MKRWLALILGLVMLIGLIPAAHANGSTTAVSATTGATTTTTTPPPATNTGTTQNPTGSNTTTTTTPTTTPTDTTTPPTSDQVVTTPVTTGAQPGTLAYAISQLIEQVRVIFTTNAARRAELFAQQAAQRLAEIEKLQTAQQPLAEQLGEAYLARLQRAVDNLVKAQLEGEDVDEAERRLIEASEGGRILAALSNSFLSQKLLEQIAEAAEKASLTAAVVSDVPQEVVTQLLDSGFGYGEIALINILATKSGKTPAEVAAMYKEQGFAKTATTLGLTVADLMSSGTTFVETIKAMQPEKVKELREEGCSYGKIAVMKLLADMTGKPLADIQALVDAKGLGQAVKELGYSMPELRHKIKELRDAEEEDEGKLEQDGDDDDQGEDADEADEQEDGKTSLTDHKNTGGDEHSGIIDPGHKGEGKGKSKGQSKGQHESDEDEGDHDD